MLWEATGEFETGNKYEFIYSLQVASKSWSLVPQAGRMVLGAQRASAPCQRVCLSHTLHAAVSIKPAPEGAFSLTLVPSGETLSLLPSQQLILMLPLPGACAALSGRLVGACPALAMAWPTGSSAEQGKPGSRAGCVHPGPRSCTRTRLGWGKDSLSLGLQPQKQCHPVGLGGPRTQGSPPACGDCVRGSLSVAFACDWLSCGISKGDSRGQAGWGLGDTSS